MEEGKEKVGRRRCLTGIPEEAKRGIVQKMEER